jgi:oligopeptide transport system substrate-binding protein
MIAADAALTNYEAGALDAVGVPGTDLDRILADPTLSAEYSTGPGTCSFYYGLNTTKAPTDDVRVRRALSMALDRQLLADTIWKPAVPAYFFSISILNAAPTQDQYPDLVIKEDIEAARALMDDYVAEKGEIPTMNLIYRTGSTTSELTAAALQEMWQDAFGDSINVEISSQEWAVFLETRKTPEAAPNIWGLLGWCQDYTDTNNFLFDVWHSTTILNGTGFLSEEFDALVEEAQTLTDTEARRDLYAQAEYILTNEVATIIPVYYNASSRLTKPYVERPAAVANVFQFELWDINR